MLSVKNSKIQYVFQNLARFVLNILSLPHSNAACERLFSKVNLIKTKTRNRLVTDTINGTILASECVNNFNNGCVNLPLPTIC